MNHRHPTASSPAHAATSMMDAGAMLISGLCLVHCLALPLLLALLPLAAASFVADEHFHRWLLLAIVPVSALALVSGCRRHRSLRVLLCGAAAVTLLVFAAYGNSMVGLSPLGESILTIAGGLLLAAAHFINLRLHRQMHHAGSQDEPA